MNPSCKIKQTKVCLVHDWLVAMRGGEKVLEALAEIIPDAPIYTLFASKKNLSPLLQQREIHTSFLQMIPGITRFYRWLLPLFPIAIHYLDVKKYDIVISSSHCVAKAIPVKKNGIHICYCHTPMRYLWGFQSEYFNKFSKVIRWIVEAYFKWLRKWDKDTSKNVSLFIANSQNTAEKILNLYGKKAVVINPPVSVGNDNKDTQGKESGNYFLVVSALVPYKRIDLAIEAFNELKEPLKIVGEGPLKPTLQKMIRFPEIELEGWLDEQTLWKRYANCRAVIFPGEEDFGIVPVEAQLFGKPVIAFGKGGVSETVIGFKGDGPVASESTGLFFYEASVDELIREVKKFKSLNFDPLFIQSYAKKFARSSFQFQIKDLLKTLLNQSNLHESTN